MVTKPILSLLMAVYNNELYVREAIESVLCQTSANWELIIIDDGSVDLTPEIVEEYANDERITVFHQHNKGIYETYNIGYEKASGEYILILNSDDRIGNKTVEIVEKAVATNEPDLILFNMVAVLNNANGLISEVVYGKQLENFCESEIQSIHNKWIEWLYYGYIEHQCIYKKRLYKRYKYRTDYVMADQFYNIAIADDVKSVYGTKYCIYYQNVFKTGKCTASNKFYGYEHLMRNEFYHEIRTLMDKWEIEDLEIKNLLISMQMKHITWNIKRLINELMPDANKITKIIFSEYIDDETYSFINSLGRREELEARILSGLRSLYIHEHPRNNEEYFFVYKMVLNLLRYEKTDTEMKEIKDAIANEKNRYNIGEAFYKLLMNSLNV